MATSLKKPSKPGNNLEKTLNFEGTLKFEILTLTTLKNQDFDVNFKILSKCDCMILDYFWPFEVVKFQTFPHQWWMVIILIPTAISR